MGLAGMAAIGLGAPLTHKEALIIVETDGCFSDGIEVATGAVMGHRTLRLVDEGKIAATFANVNTGQVVRLSPQCDVRERALTYAPGVKKKYYAQLKGYQIMPDEELFSYQDIKLEPALQAIISRPGIRVKCRKCGEEIINERQVLVGGKWLCKTCAGISYYRVNGQG